jgi:hypothetical protein
MSRFARFIWPFVVAAMLPIVLSGCAAHRAQARAKLPIAETVCLQIDGVKEPEKGFLTRKATAYLGEQGFRVVESNCDLKLGYSALDERQWELMARSLLGTRSSTSYRVEGLISLSGRGGEVISEDQPVDLRDYGSKSDVIEALAWEMAGYITESFRPK